MELHGFADASKAAYGAVLYLRLLQESVAFTSLQVAKSKVAPVKKLSIPRLELCASLILTRLAKKFLDSTTLDICDVHLWTDSTDVLFWLRDHPSRWNLFIANRCSEIHTSLPNAIWHHVKSKENPADVLSRGTEPFKLQSNELWWKGPAFLVEEIGTWPKKKDELNFFVSNVTTANVCKVTRNITSQDDTGDLICSWSPINKYSTLNKVLRVTSYCLRFIIRISINLRSNRNREYKVLNLSFFNTSINYTYVSISSTEIAEAEFLCCYLVQRPLFENEYSLIMADKRLSNKNPLAALNPVIQNHLIRVGGRLVNSLADSRVKISYHTTSFMRSHYPVHTASALALAAHLHHIFSTR